MSLRFVRHQIWIIPMPHQPTQRPERQSTTHVTAAVVKSQSAPLVTTGSLILCVSQFAFFSSDRMLWVVLPLHLQELGLGYSAIGLVLGAFTLSSATCFGVSLLDLAWSAGKRDGETVGSWLFLFRGSELLSVVSIVDHSYCSLAIVL